MPDGIGVGTLVRLLRVPEWLVHDLPGEDRALVESHVGRAGVVGDIDPHGYLWIAFDEADPARPGASVRRDPFFCVSSDCVAVLA